MSSAAASQLHIPRDWVKALPYLADLRQRMPLTQDEWRNLCDWLAGTCFDEQSALAGELAVILIRDFAPQEFRQQLGRIAQEVQFPKRLKSLSLAVASSSDETN